MAFRQVHISSDKNPASALGMRSVRWYLYRRTSAGQPPYLYPLNYEEGIEKESMRCHY